MKKVTFRPRAWEDVQQSAEYLADEASVQVAEHFLDAVIEVTRRLAEMPQIGSRCQFDHAGLRGMRRLPVIGFEKLLIFYQASDNGVEVVRVLHGARDIASILSPEAWSL